MKYTGIKCPSCGIPFQQDDDVVVCPDCGAPYHRHCYEKEGKCLFSDTHNTGTYWAPPSESTHTHNEADIVCSTCGRNNPPDSLFCSRCGSSLKPGNEAQSVQKPQHNNIPGYQNPYQSTGYQNPGSPASPTSPFEPPKGDSPYQSAPNPFSPVTIRADEPMEEDITAGEIAKFVQNNSSYFLTVFFHKKRTTRNHFSFSAFLFSGGWLLYRKMYRLGSIITAWMAALYVTSTFIWLNYTSPLLTRLYEQAGVSTSVYPSYEELMKVTQLLYQLDTGSIFLLFTPLLTLAIRGIIMLYCGFAGNRLYYQHSVESIRHIKEEYPITEDYDKALQEKGGVNVSLALCLLICYSIIIYLPSFFS